MSLYEPKDSKDQRKRGIETRKKILSSKERIKIPYEIKKDFDNYHFINYFFYIFAKVFINT